MLDEQQQQKTYVSSVCAATPADKGCGSLTTQSRMLAGWIAVPGECLVECVLTQNPCGSPDKVIFLFILPSSCSTFHRRHNNSDHHNSFLPSRQRLRSLFGGPFISHLRSFTFSAYFFDIGSWIQILAGLT